MENNQRIPLIVLRSFQDGHGLAYHTSLKPKVLAIYEGLKEVDRRPNDTRFQVPLEDGETLIGDKQADPNCPDLKARTRFPYVVRAAVIDRSLDKASTDALYSKLQGVSLPECEGPTSNLEVAIEVAPVLQPLDHRKKTTVPVEQRRVPAPTDASAGCDTAKVKQPLTWHLISLVALPVAAWLWLPLHISIPTFVWVLLAFLVGSAVSWLFCARGLPQLEVDGVKILEAQLLEGLGSNDLQSLFAQRFSLVLPQGKELRSLEKGRFPLSIRQSSMKQIQLGPGTVFVGGVESISEPHAAPRSAHFIRCYRFERTFWHGAWKLATAQWTWAETAGFQDPKDAKLLVESDQVGRHP